MIKEFSILDGFCDVLNYISFPFQQENALNQLPILQIPPKIFIFKNMRTLINTSKASDADPAESSVTDAAESAAAEAAVTAVSSLAAEASVPRGT
jgi:hypothetical protein